MRRVILVVAVISVATVAFAQSKGQESIADTYSLPFLHYYEGTPGIAVPHEMYTSVRLLGLSAGFTGLVRDSLTDYMTNPGAGAPGPVRLYADVGRTSDGEAVYAGTFVKAGNQGVSLILRVQNVFMTINRFSTLSSPGTYDASNNLATSSRENSAGADLRYSLSLPGGISIGAGYQFSYSGSNSGFRQEDSHKWLPDSGYSSQGNLDDYSNSGPVNRLLAGVRLPTAGGSLQVYACATTTAEHPDETESSLLVNQATSSADTETVVYRTELRGKSVFGGAIYESGDRPEAVTRYLLEVGYSSYDGNGAYRLDRPYPGSQQEAFFHSRRLTEGTILDLRLAIGTSRKVADVMRIFAGANLLYAKNSFHTSEPVEPGSSVPSLDTFGNMTGSWYAASISFPFGFEYRLNDVLSLRGGAEEGYTYDNYSSRNTVYSQFGGASRQAFSGSLWSVISAGSTYRIGDKVRVDLFISYDFLQVRGSSLALFYSL